MAYELTKEFSFHAAHSLTSLPKEHKCSHMHGHTYRVLFTVSGKLDPKLGWVVDFGVMAHEADKMHELLDHKVLNDVEGLGMPTSENLARFIFDNMKDKLKGLVRVSVYETPTSLCTYSPYEEGIRIRIGPRHFSAVHMVLSEEFEEPLHGHDFSLSLDFYCAYDQGMEAKALAEELLDEILETYHNKTILPGSPEEGELDVYKDRVEFSWKGRKLVLKPRDVKILEDQAHSTVEIIADDIALYLRTVLLQDKGFDMDRIEVFLQESPESWASVKLFNL